MSTEDISICRKGKLNSNWAVFWDISFWLIGLGFFQQKMSTLLKKNGVPSNLHFIGLHL